jgi:nickel-dependent lactate racemase
MDSPALSRLAEPVSSALIVIPDTTRVARADILLPLVINELISAGLESHQITIIIATGTHRFLTSGEIAGITGNDIAETYRIIQHDSRETDRLRSLCTTARGTEAALNSAVFEHELVITIGSINAHYFAGFGGGRKLLFPGLAGRQGVIYNHLLSVDFQEGRLAEGVEPCNLAGNPVHLDMMEIVSHRPPDFAINVLLNQEDEIAVLRSGHWRISHEAACADYMERHSVLIDEKYDAVIASCGGYPKDIDLIQSHKSVQHACRALKPGGKLLFLAECRDGLGTKGFDMNFPITDPVQYADRLRAGDIKNGQTALAIAQKAREFEIAMLTSLPREFLWEIGFRPVASFHDGLEWIASSGTTALIPRASITIPIVM